MPDYSKGKIYKILNHIDDKIYVGSTIKTLSQRMAQHRSCVNGLRQSTLYKHMHEIGIENFYIELIENYSCNDIYELRAREGHFIRQIGTLNKQIAGITNQFDTLKEYKHYYYQNNLDIIKDKSKQYRVETKEEKRIYDKNLYDENKQYIKERVKQYQENNKDKIKEITKETIVCDCCGSVCTKYKLSRHKATKKCKLIANRQNLPISE